MSEEAREKEQEQEGQNELEKELNDAFSSIVRENYGELGAGQPETEDDGEEEPEPEPTTHVSRMKVGDEEYELPELEDEPKPEQPSNDSTSRQSDQPGEFTGSVETLDTVADRLKGITEKLGAVQDLPESKEIVESLGKIQEGLKTVGDRQRAQLGFLEMDQWVIRDAPEHVREAVGDQFLHDLDPSSSKHKARVELYRKTIELGNKLTGEGKKVPDLPILLAAVSKTLHGAGTKSGDQPLDEEGKRRARVLSEAAGYSGESRKGRKGGEGDPTQDFEAQFQAIMQEPV